MIKRRKNGGNLFDFYDVKSYLEVGLKYKTTDYN